MKPLTLALSGLLCAGMATAQTLFTYGRYAVPVQEFVTAFDKNPNTADRRKAMEEYLPLFINYKLKVQDAYDKKMDTLPNQVGELQQYRAQLEESFLAQLSNTEALVNEAWRRSQTDIKLRHLFIGFLPADSQNIKEAEARASQALQLLQKGKPFAEVVNSYSTDPENKAQQGEVGWITAFTLPYLYESALYQTPVSQFTPVMRGSDGFHIFQPTQMRPAAGKVQVSQILLWTPADADAATVARNQQLADSLHAALKKGAAFDALALQYSTDRSSYATGGMLAPFGVCSYDPLFEDQAFALQRPGDLSAPFRTPYGWHILKLEKKIPVANDVQDAEGMGALRQQVLNDTRAQLARQQLLRSKMAALPYKREAFAFDQLWRYTDSARRNANTAGMPVQNKTLLYTMGNEKVLAENWLMYVRASRSGADMGPAQYQQLWDTYVLQTAEVNYRSRLEAVEPAFKAQLKEFKDANLLFENMDKQVWTAAATDADGQQAYYAAHRTKYVWAHGATAVVAATNDSAAAIRLREALRQQPGQWRQLAEAYKEQAVLDSNRYEWAQLPGQLTGAGAQAQTATPIVHNPVDGSYSFAYLLQLKPGGEARSLDEARGYVITDYQQQLEEQWVAKLRKKYPVKVNEVVWKQLLLSSK